MRIEKEHPELGKIVYQESFWTGRRSILVNGTALTRHNNKQFGNDEIKATVMGNLFSGIVINFSGTFVVMSQKTLPIEYILAFFPVLLIIIWANSPKLYSIIPIIGGAIGGGVSGGCGAVALIYMKLRKNIFGKILVALISLVVAFILCNIIAVYVFGSRL